MQAAVERFFVYGRQSLSATTSQVAAQGLAAIRLLNRAYQEQLLQSQRGSLTEPLSATFRKVTTDINSPAVRLSDLPAIGAFGGQSNQPNLDGYFSAMDESIFRTAPQVPDDRATEQALFNAIDNLDWHAFVNSQPSDGLQLSMFGTKSRSEANRRELSPTTKVIILVGRILVLANRHSFDRFAGFAL